MVEVRAGMKPNFNNSLVQRIRPLWPVNALVPGSRCPHGIRIGRDRVCGVCHVVAKRTQQEIDAGTWPAPENPEDRVLKQIGFYREWLVNHPEAPTRIKLHIARQISRLEAEFAYWMSRPKYRPDPKLKGGK